MTDVEKFNPLRPPAFAIASRFAAAAEGGADLRALLRERS